MLKTIDYFITDRAKVIWENYKIVKLHLRNLNSRWSAQPLLFLTLYLFPKISDKDLCCTLVPKRELTRLTHFDTIKILICIYILLYQIVLSNYFWGSLIFYLMMHELRFKTFLDLNSSFRELIYTFFLLIFHDSRDFFLFSW